MRGTGRSTADDACSATGDAGYIADDDDAGSTAGNATCSATIDSPADARAHIERACFDLRPPRLIGAELEWVTATRSGHRPSAVQLAAALGRHAPASIAAGSPHDPLPQGGKVTVEPGGQVEISSAPLPGPEVLSAALASDAATLHALLVAGGVQIVGGAVDCSRPPSRVLQLARYAAMQARFDGHGPFGAAMMCNTAAVHISVDCGADAADLGARWRMLNTAGPALLAAFADSPRSPAGRAGDDGARWASHRMRTCLALDPGRTGMDSGAPGASGDPIASYADWALSAPLLCVQRPHDDWSVSGDVSFGEWIEGSGAAPDRAPTTADLAYHLTTLFPPVRPCGHLEARYFDAQPDGRWRIPIAVVDALTRSPQATTSASTIAAPTAGAWRRAARDGLADPDLRDTAVALIELAAEYAEKGQYGDGAGAGATDETVSGVELASEAERCKRGVRPSGDEAYGGH